MKVRRNPDKPRKGKTNRAEEKKHPPLSIVAMGKSGRSDTVDTQEDALLTGLDPHGRRKKKAARRRKARARRD